jgi:hypothetical protein
MSTHLNEYRQKRTASREQALPALCSRFTIGTPRYWNQLLDTIERVPICEAAAALRHVYAPKLARPDKLAVLRFLCLSRKIWELESEACPLPVHRGCPND